MTGKEFKNKLHELIDDHHFHESIQLHDDLPKLTTNAHDAKRKDTSKIENGPTDTVQNRRAWQHAQSKDLPSLSGNEWLNSKILKVIAVVGQSCAGKSNLAKSILRSQLIEKFFQYRFYISLKGSCEEKMNLLTFLTQRKLNLRWVEKPNTNEHTRKCYDTMINELNRENVCIVFDDFGIGSFSHNKDEEQLSCFEQHLSKQFFSSIMKHELLCKAKVVMVLNHWDYEHIIKNMRSQTWTLVHVLGIDEKDQTRMVEGMLCDSQTCCAYNTTRNETAISNINSLFESHVGTNNCLLCKYPSLSNCSDEFRVFLNVPVHCQSFLEHWSGCRIADTSYLLLKWLKYITYPYPKTYNLIKVGKFAWTQYIRNVFLFAFKDLQELSKIERNMFFIGLRHIQGGAKNIYYRFSNILLQDFLAAVWCLSLSDVELKENQAQFKKWNDSEIVIGFMKEIYQIYQQYPQFKLDLPLNQKNIDKIEKFSSQSNNNKNVRIQRRPHDAAHDVMRNFLSSKTESSRKFFSRLVK